MSSNEHFDGGCDCGNVRYRLTDKPIVVHCCHCRWCQRETGSAFAVNAVIESDRVTVLNGELAMVAVPSESGNGQTIARCPNCQIAVWSHYSSAGERLSMIRVGTLDNPDLVPPEVNIYVESKQPWVKLNDGTPSFDQYYDRKKTLSEESLDRFRAIFR